MNDPRANIFTIGHRYRLKRTFESGPKTRFSEGEVVTYARVSYSRYDGCFVHEFNDANGKVKEWWLGEDEPIEKWRDFFEDDSGGNRNTGMNYKITVEQGLAAHFKQATGPSRPGIDWMIKIEGPKSGVVIVRTYLKAAVATEQEKVLLSERALDLVQRKIETGWDPSIREGIIEVADGPEN